jgi:hypothetical protein
VNECNTPAPCYRDRDNGVRFVRNGHQIDCAEVDCRGCKPCAERRHCSGKKNCSWHIPEGTLTCGRCIADVRRDLRWIGDLSALVAIQALADGVNSEAANLAGPAADPRALAEWQIARKLYLRAFEARGKITEAQHLHALEALSDDNDEHHPYAVLTRWQMMVSEDYGHDMPARLSTLGALAYLDRTLHRIANDDEQDFLLLKGELKRCRQHLEAVLHNDEQRDRGAPCPDCVSTGLGAPRLERRYALAQPHDRYDTWRCPRVREHEWSHHAYIAYVEDRKSGRIGA